MNDDIKIAELDGKLRRQLFDFENQARMDTGRNIILVAYERSEAEQATEPNAGTPHSSTSTHPHADQ